MNKTTQHGVLMAIAAYTMWGLAPVYFKSIEHVPSLEILIHRVVWSCGLLFILIAAQQHWQKLKLVISDYKTLGLLVVCSLFLAVNWWLFIWAVNNGHMLDASLGYYINPLFNVAMGMIFFSERLSKLQWFAVGLAVTGVLIQLVAFGSIPYIALTLAASFSIYGLIRKKIAVDAVTGLLIESLVLVVPAVIYWVFFASSAQSNMFDNSWALNVLLVLAGVITTIPLLCFVGAAKRLKYSTLGFFQYIGPSIMFLFAVFAYQEQFNNERWVTFGFIWLALLVFTLASIRASKRS